MAAKRAKPARLVMIPADGVKLEGSLTIPDRSVGAVVVVHDSGAHRSSPALLPIARGFQESGLTTLLIDLLTPAEEEQWGMYRDNYVLHAARLVRAFEFLQERPETRSHRVGFFAVGRGLVGALLAAERLPQLGAIVGGSGRPDLAGPNLFMVQAPTLLLVGGNDTPLLILNEKALLKLAGQAHRVGIISGVSDPLATSAARDELLSRARAWFAHYLGATDPAAEAPTEVWHSTPR